MSQPKIVAFAGSLRTDSFTTKLSPSPPTPRAPPARKSRSANFADLALPLFGPDIGGRGGLPEGAKIQGAAPGERRFPDRFARIQHSITLR